MDMKILIIAPEYMGYMVKVADELRKRTNVTVLDIHIPTYEYSSALSRVQNFFLKKISKDIKYTYRKNYIEERIKDQKFDTILIIRPDLLSVEYIRTLKNHSSRLITYFFDGIHRFPKKFKSLELFDTIFSFEPDDCQQYGFTFITNFIYDEDISINISKYSVFNIMSYDRKRFPILEKIAKNLKANNIKYKFIVKFEKKTPPNSLIESIYTPISLEETRQYILDSKCVLDIGVTHKHKGLTFRVFEAMGLQKKLITNNADTRRYDFYNPQNILIIDGENPEIPIDFLESEYDLIPDAIYQKYTLRNWVNTVFNL